MRKYRNYTDQDIINAVKKVKSFAALLRELNLKQAGGNYANMKRNLQRLNVDTKHWTGQGWSKGEQLKDWSKYTKSVHLKKHLIRERGHKCEYCKNEIWMDNPITLEVHHLDGNRGNNELTNLQLLCCNCHALTDTWRKQKINAFSVDFEG